MRSPFVTLHRGDWFVGYRFARRRLICESVVQVEEPVTLDRPLWSVQWHRHWFGRQAELDRATGVSLSEMRRDLPWWVCRVLSQAYGKGMFT